MAYSPHISVRMAPSTLAALEYLAQRDGEKPATLARIVLTSYVQQRIQSENRHADFQTFYRQWQHDRAQEILDRNLDVLQAAAAPDSALTAKIQ